MIAQVKESYFWQQIKTGLESADTHLSRIENSAGTGISDVSACHKGVEVWIELKIFHGNQLSFRNSQRTWIARRAAVGGIVWVVARKDDEIHIYDAELTINCKHTPRGDKAFTINKSDLPVPSFSCKKPFKWEAIKLTLFPEPQRGL